MEKMEIDLSKMDKKELLNLLEGLYRTQKMLNDCVVSCQTFLHMVTVLDTREFHPIRTLEDATIDPWNGVREEMRASTLDILQEAYRLASVSDHTECREEARP